MQEKKTTGNFILRIDIPALFAFILFAGLIFIYLIPGFEKAMMDRKREMIHEISSSAYTLLDYYNSLEKKGILDSLSAKSRAAEAISSIRYGEELKDYFWITDMYPRMIIHPYRSDLNGKDLSDFRDSEGKQVFVDFVRSVIPNGESYVNYMWQWNDDSTRIVPKLSYVRLYKPWGWVIGTGIYVEDVRTEIKKIELRALIISVIIGVLIILLLTVVSLQGHKIEAKRSRAEEELRKSKELYKALAGAASEGVLIWSSLGMQGNKTLLSWIGYTEEELLRLTIRDLINPEGIPELSSSEDLYDELNTRQYADCSLKANDGSLIHTHADFSRILMGAIKAVMIVFRPVMRSASSNDFSVDTSLLNRIGTGFFRTTFGKKNRFLQATKPVIEIFGYNSLQELLRESINSRFVNSIQLKIFNSALLAREPVSLNEILLRKKNGDTFWALLNAAVIESPSGELWCEWTIEPLALHNYMSDLPLTDLASYSASFVMQSPVKLFMEEAVILPENLSCAQALAIMKEKESDFIVVADKNGEAVGVCDSGSLGLNIVLKGQAETAIFRVMYYPPLSVLNDTSMNEAVRMLNDSASKCLIVKSGQDKIMGIISLRDLLKGFSSAPELIFADIGKASNSSELHSIFLKSRLLEVSMILGHADPLSISRFISSVADSICRRIITLCLDESGNPPCRFAFIQTGSAGRMEQTLCTDQDNAIIFEEQQGEDLRTAEAYFLDLAQRVNNMLSAVGYELCKGANMASNPKWCQPLNVWKKYFSDWIRMPGPEELLDISIFFDFRHCYGEAGLTEELREFVNGDLKKNDIFFHHMAAGWKQFRQATHFNPDGITDIKKIMMPLTAIIRLYALRQSSGAISTIDRILGLYPEGHLQHNILRDTIRAWKDLTSARLIHQSECITKGEEPDNLIDFRTDDGKLRYFAEQSISTIGKLMLQADTDFYNSTI